MRQLFSRTVVLFLLVILFAAAVRQRARAEDLACELHKVRAAVQQLEEDFYGKVPYGGCVATDVVGE